MNEDDGGKNIEGVDDVEGRLQMYFSKKPNPYKKKFHVSRLCNSQYNGLP